MGFAIKRVAKWIGAIMHLSFVMFAGLVLYLLSTRFVLPWDYSYKLSGKQDTIEVWHIGWTCDCAEWGIVGEDFPEDDLALNSIFIEAEPEVENYSEANLDSNCWAHKLKLIGQFYQNEGISRDYEIIIENPNKARVFRYNQYEVTDVWCSPGIDESEQLSNRENE